MSLDNWSEMRDSELVESCLSGDQKAYGELMERYGKVIYVLALKRTEEPEIARDITQDALVDAYLGLPDLREPAKFGQWIKAITLNLCSDWVRRISREVPIDKNMMSDSTPPDREVENKELREMVHRAISQLSTENQRAIRLFYFDGLSCRQVAEFLDISSDAVRNRLHESVKRLRKELSQMGVEQKRKRANIRHITQFGDPAQYSFGGNKKEFYAAIYPSCDLADKPWEGIMDEDEAQRLLAQWESVQFVRRTTRKIYGLVPICMPDDARQLKLWYEHFSCIASATLEIRIGELRDLICKAVPSNEVDNVLGIVVICWALGARTGPLTSLTFSAGDGRLEREPGRQYACFGFDAATEQFSKRNAGYVCRGCDDDWRWLGIHHGVNRGALINRISRWGKYYGGFEDGAYCIFNAMHAIADETVSPSEFRYAALGARVKQHQFEDYVQDLLDIHFIEEVDGRYRLAFPVLRHSQMKPVTHTAMDIAQKIVDQLPGLMEDLSGIAAQCSFADCLFNDVFQMVWCEALSCVLDALVESGLLPNWPESALGEWGVWLYCTDK